jgi:hypothetical protein
MYHHSHPLSSVSIRNPLKKEKSKKDRKGGFKNGTPRILLYRHVASYYKEKEFKSVHHR